MSQDIQSKRVSDTGRNVFMIHSKEHAHLARRWVQDSAVVFSRESMTWPAAQRFTDVYLVSHNLAIAFRQVLRSMARHVSALERQGRFNNVDRDHIDSIKRHFSQGVDLAYKLMLFSGNIPVKPEPIDLNDVVRKVDPIIRHTVKSGINTEVDLAEEALLINGDEKLLREILANLISNANDAVPKGGTIAVATRRVQREYLCSFPECKHPMGACALLSVVDSGPGIDASIQHRILEPFFTTKRSDERIGLGLPIVQAIVHAHHGCLDIVSRKKEGTMVRIYLPLVEPLLEADKDESA